MKLCELDYWNGTVLNVAHGMMTGKMLGLDAHKTSINFSRQKAAKLVVGLAKCHDQKGNPRWNLVTQTIITLEQRQRRQLGWSLVLGVCCSFGSGVLGVIFLLSPETHAGRVKSALLPLLVTLAASPQSQAQPAKKSGIYSHTLYQATCSTLPHNGEK
jgi:hypothetical protein